MCAAARTTVDLVVSVASEKLGGVSPAAFLSFASRPYRVK